jgi:DNA replication protein DnaC
VRETGCPLRTTVRCPLTIALERAREQLETLGLIEAAATLDARLEAASKREMPYADFLAELLHAELHVRRQRYLQTRTKLARLPFKKTLEQFDFDAQPSIDSRQINELASLSFIAHADNLMYTFSSLGSLGGSWVERTPWGS